MPPRECRLAGYIRFHSGVGRRGSVGYLREVGNRKDTTSAKDQPGSVYRRVEPATPKTVLLDGLKKRMTVALARGGEVLRLRGDQRPQLHEDAVGEAPYDVAVLVGEGGPASWEVGDLDLLVHEKVYRNP